MNSDHYASWMVHLGGARLVCYFSLYSHSLPSLIRLKYTLFSQITKVADKVGVGVHFNPFVSWNDRVITSRETVAFFIT